MSKLGSDIDKLINSLSKGSDAARINMRTHEVLNRYKAAIESVYDPKTAQLHLLHTNKVIISNKDGIKTLLVYVDNSLYAAELNAQRELIRLKLLELFGEDVERFEIKTSKWTKYRVIHPYEQDDQQVKKTTKRTPPLNEEERAFVEQTCSVVKDNALRKSLEKAMASDLRRHKGENMEQRRKNTK